MITGKRFWSHGTSEPGSDKPARLYWFEASRVADGMTSFTPHQIDDQSGIGTQFVVADFNGDGLLDIVTANKKGVFLFGRTGMKSIELRRSRPSGYRPSRHELGQEQNINGLIVDGRLGDLPG